MFDKYHDVNDDVEALLSTVLSLLSPNTDSVSIRNDAVTAIVVVLFKS